MTTKNISILSALFITGAIVGCAKISTVNTNLDRENFEHYFSPSRVAIYESEQNFIGKYQFIGAVEGENCQAKAHLAAPDPIEARTEARRAAYQLGANAIVFSGCAEIEDKTKHCHASVICYGKAYQVEQTGQEK
ncbi:Rcs stress response system protein RcsF [Thalassotalea euphylliae]|uniref:Rcs stress response system protein RcsF n=1 Tax=Thalassotalea euphylliae TaxID=1655234 RepID=UPI00362FD101